MESHVHCGRAAGLPEYGEELAAEFDLVRAGKELEEAARHGGIQGLLAHFICTGNAAAVPLRTRLRVELRFAVAADQNFNVACT